MIDHSSYGSAYSKESFWEKIGNLSDAYKELKYKAILLWLLLTDEDVPVLVKASIITVLGLFSHSNQIHQRFMRMIGFSLLKFKQCNHRD